MSTLKVIKNRIKSVGNTQKISKTMRLVSAAKYSKAERELLQIRPFGNSPQVFYNAAGLTPISEPESRLVVAMSGDRGLCGSIHAGIARSVYASIEAFKKFSNPITGIVCIGDKNRVILSRIYNDKILWIVSNVGKKPATFIDAGLIADQLLQTMDEYKFSRIQIYFNKFISAGVFSVKTIDLYDRTAIYSAPKFALYDAIDDHIVDCWIEFAIATTVYWLLKEGSVSEHLARMTAMENATQNATAMIKDLNIQFNRTRQAEITRELIEIISGASAIQCTNY